MYVPVMRLCCAVLQLWCALRYGGNRCSCLLFAFWNCGHRRFQPRYSSRHFGHRPSRLHFAFLAYRHRPLRLRFAFRCCLHLQLRFRFAVGRCSHFLLLRSFTFRRCCHIHVPLRRELSARAMEFAHNRWLSTQIQRRCLRRWH